MSLFTAFFLFHRASTQVLADVKAALHSAVEKQRVKVEASKGAAAGESSEKKREPLLQVSGHGGGHWQADTLNARASTLNPKP